MGVCVRPVRPPSASAFIDEGALAGLEFRHSAKRVQSGRLLGQGEDFELLFLGLRQRVETQSSVPLVDAEERFDLDLGADGHYVEARPHRGSIHALLSIRFGFCYHE